MAAGWDFLVAKDDLARTEFRPLPAPAAVTLAAGEVLVEIERFSFTANNITYAVFGDQLGYWRFFNAAEGWGRIPVWGFGRVSRSNVDAVEVGARLYGYWPMSTQYVAQLRPAGSGYVDAAEHRASLPAPYNQYFDAPERPVDDLIALLRPLFSTSFLLDHLLAKIAPGATAILSSASSRTALGLAWLLARRGTRAAALTSPGNVGFVEKIGLFGAIAPYDEIEQLAIDGPVVFVDFAGDAAVRERVHRAFAERLLHSAVVGGTRHEASANATRERLPGPRPAFFFAPDQFVERAGEIGARALTAEIEAGLLAFGGDGDWLHIDHYRGPDELTRMYEMVRSGTASPDRGAIALPR